MSDLAGRCAVACLMALIFVMSAASIAIADVDTTGNLRKVPILKSRPGEVEPLFEKASGDYECYSYSDVQNAADSFVIGNCDAPWQIQVVSYSGPNGEGYHSYGGFITGNFSGCGWIETRFEPKKLNGNKNSACGEGSTGDFEVPQSYFMERHNSAAGDGWPVVTTQACPEYANYRPWSSNNVEQELIRTAPAYASSGPGSNYPALKWRYITKYESTDGTHRYVMVRDDRYNAGEGNWVFVPRSCLPSTLPENESERLPPPPTVTTDGASEVASAGARLNATINPNGVDTQYFFEYGTTESYGLYTSAENAGAGTSPVPVSAAIGGLESSTTYYFRIVASSATGEVFGGPVAFTTQPVPPSATTAPASSVQPLQATLNGTVNSNGLDTHYYFQYGTSPSYGSTTGEVDAGSGRSAAPASATVGLSPGTTYHYRIVATNAAEETSYGTEQTFTTPGPVEAVTTSPSTITEEEAHLNGTVNPHGYDAKYYFQYGTSTSYTSSTSEGDAGAGLSPEPENATITALQPGTTYHYRLVATSGGVTSEGHDESFTTLEPEMSSRWAIRNGANGEQYVYYQGVSGDMNYWGWNGKEWFWFERAGHPAAAGTSPTVVRNPANGEEQFVYYQGANGNIDYWGWNGKEWFWYELAGHAASAGTSPTVVRNAVNGFQYVYYQGANGNIDYWGWNGKEWFWHERAGHPAAAGTSPTVVRNPANGEELKEEQFVYYQGANGNIDYWGWNGKEWFWYERAGHPA
ncbi:MAG TPA: hypothetical protein VIJ50_03605 [Solirubrobacteraceae bacterium]